MHAHALFWEGAGRMLNASSFFNPLSILPNPTLVSKISKSKGPHCSEVCSVLLEKGFQVWFGLVAANSSIVGG